jgi:glycosyltransferase involved in cell wall biosynthesis
MKKILFLNANLLSGGAERQMVTVARLLKKQGHQVSFYCYETGDFYGSLLKEDGIPVVWEYSYDKPIRRIFHIRRYIQNGNYDVVITFMTPANFINEVASLGGKKWKVITGLRFCPQSADKTIKEKVYNWFRKYSDVVVSNSERAARSWKEFHPKSPVDFKVIYNHVKLGEIHSTYIRRADGRLHIVVAASFQYLKNPIGLAKALALMSPDDRRKVVVDWYGGGSQTQVYKDTQKVISENGLEGVFCLHDATKDIYDRMNEADVVMLPSQFEGLPNAICEGMTLSKPVIMTKVSDYDILVDETNGLLCDADNPETIRDAILQMVQFDNATLLELGRCSAEKAKRLFSSESIVAQWEQLLIN